MTQRFGRNQRRRAREALTAASQRVTDLERAHALDRALQADMRTRMDALAQKIDDARAIAGPMSILFPVEHEFARGSKAQSTGNCTSMCQGACLTGLSATHPPRR